MSTNNSLQLVEEMIRVSCQAKGVQGSYEADVPVDITGAEIVEGLGEQGYLPALGGTERWVVIHPSSGREVTGALKDVGVQEGDQLVLDRQTHGAGARR
jgi:hypothetical protein